jgi:hypothetical protein
MEFSFQQNSLLVGRASLNKKERKREGGERKRKGRKREKKERNYHMYVVSLSSSLDSLLSL